jgi:hypothetical protein
VVFVLVQFCMIWLKQNTQHCSYLLTPWPQSARELYRQNDRRLSAKLVPTSADRGCHVVSGTDLYDRILGYLDQTCCVNLIDNTHYAPITTTPSTRTKYFTRTLALSTSLEHFSIQTKIFPQEYNYTLLTCFCCYQFAFSKLMGPEVHLNHV